PPPAQGCARSPRDGRRVARAQSVEPAGSAHGALASNGRRVRGGRSRRASGPRVVDVTTERLTDFACSFSYADLPIEVVHQVKRTLLDAVACGIGGFSGEP